MISYNSNYKKSGTICKPPTSPEKIIKLPNQTQIIPIQPIPANKKSNDNLASMCNFEPGAESFSPPDKYFMQNLRRRMETV